MRALDDIRIIDFGQHLAGPFGPMVLADLGADVIKVEPVVGDAMRMAGKPFFGCQRGKRSIAIDLKKPEGRELALELVATADVVHHNMTVGVATRLGIDYQACRAMRPDVIYCNTYAYGLEGPLAHFGGLDPLYQASAGLEYESGSVMNGNDPMYYRFGMCDASNAMLSVIGLLMALYHRDRTGEGQELWTSLLDGSMVFSSDVVLVDGRPVPHPHLDKDQRGLDPRYRLYRCQDDEWIQLACVRDDEWERALAVLELAADASEDVVEGRIATKTSQQWQRRFDDAAVPAEIARDTIAGEEFLTDADNVALGLVANYQHTTMGRLRQAGAFITLSDTPGATERPPPLLGEQTREILVSLGKSGADISTLYDAGVVCDPPPDRPW